MFAIGEWIFAGGVGRPQAAVTHDNCFTWNASVRVIIELIRMSVPKDYNVFYSQCMTELRCVQSGTVV